MSQRRFTEAREESWQHLEKVLDALEARGRSERAAEVPSLLRRVSEDLAIAEHRSYPAELVGRLNGLALRAHTLLYRARLGAPGKLFELLGHEFPRAVRRERGVLVLGFAALFGVGIAVFVVTLFRPEVPYAILGAEALQEMERMHDPKERGPRGSDLDLLMFGFYVQHNIGIAFQCYALGMLCGVGTLAMLLYNGLVLGAVFGHMHRIGLGVHLHSFAIAHGAFELTGIMLAGVAGLRLGLAILNPGSRTRRAALLAAARQGTPILAGATAMLLVAALVEASWSPQADVPTSVKFVVGTACWILVFAFLGFAGRDRR